jgi:hypothetical protein
MSCGCGQPNEDHGNADHITLEQMERAAQASNIDVETAADNIHDLAKQLRDGAVSA